MNIIGLFSGKNNVNKLAQFLEEAGVLAAI